MELVDHGLGIWPGPFGRELEVCQPVWAAITMWLVASVTKCGERLLIAPSLDNHHPHRDVLVQAALDLGQHPGLRVPFVPADPEPEDPVGWHPRPSSLLEEGSEHLVRRALEQVDLEPGAPAVRIEFSLDSEEPCIGRANVVPGAVARGDLKAPALPAGHDGEGHRQIRTPTLVLVLLEDGGIDALAALVDGVEALAEAHHVFLGCQA